MNNPIWTMGMTLADAEKEVLKRALRFFNDNKTATASSLGISIRGLDGKIKRYGLEVQDGRKKAKADSGKREADRENRGSDSKDDAGRVLPTSSEGAQGKQKGNGKGSKPKTDGTTASVD